ncbi:MAG: hypothetical protein BJ554DRAFT_2760, partial [Olpidium bornovanus]
DNSVVTPVAFPGPLQTQTIKLQGSKKSIRKSLRLMEKRANLSAEPDAGADAQPAGQPAPPGFRIIQAGVKSVGLKGLKTSTLSETIEDRERASRIAQRPVQGYFVCRDVAFLPDDYMHFDPVVTHDGKRSAYGTLKRIPEKAGFTRGPAALVRETPDMLKQLSLFNHEEKAELVLRTFMMLATTSAFTKPKLPPPDAVLTFPAMRPFTDGNEGTVKSVFNSQLTKACALRLENAVRGGFGFRYRGERCEVKARVLDLINETRHDVVFDLDPSDPRLVPVKVSKANCHVDHATFLSVAGRLDFRLRVVAKEEIPKPAAALRRQAGPAPAAAGKDAGRSEAEGGGAGGEEGGGGGGGGGGGEKAENDLETEERRRGRTAQDETADALWRFAQSFTWARAPAEAQRPAITIEYPTAGTQFVVGTWQRVRKRVFEGAHPRPAASGGADEYRVKISRVEPSDGARYYGATGSSLTINRDVTKSSYERLLNLTQFAKLISDPGVASC